VNDSSIIKRVSAGRETLIEGPVTYIFSSVMLPTGLVAAPAVLYVVPSLVPASYASSWRVTVCALFWASKRAPVPKAYQSGDGAIIVAIDTCGNMLSAVRIKSSKPVAED